jgi:hypothetical protein
MLPADLDLLRIYDETASMIMDLGIRRRISVEEMNFLLDLLELVLIKKDQQDFVDKLKQWKPGPDDDNEIDQIIKATLLNNKLSDFLSSQENQEMIRDLINEKEKGV